VQQPIPLADGGVGDSICILSYFRMLFYQNQIIQGCSPAQAGHSYQLSIYDILHLSILIDIYVYNGEFRPARPKEVGDGDGSYGEKHIFTHNFFVSTTTDTLPMTDMFVLASRMH
jgi:hypothetical protein